MFTDFGLKRGRRLLLPALAPLVLATACSPVHDWREIHPVATPIRLMFPCRPDHHERSVTVGADIVKMSMDSCSAGGAIFSLAHATAAAPDRVTALAEAWRASTAANIAAAPAPVEPHDVAGATPNQAAGLTRLQGRRGDGRPVQATAVVFVSGLVVYQAAVIGETAPPAEVVETFVAGLRIDRPAPPSR